jgi:hypothetical protein
MKTYRSALVALLLTAATAMPCSAQQAPSTPQAAPNETCAGCFAYLVFPPSFEPESYALRGEPTAISASLPAAGEPNDRPGNQTASLLTTSKQ